MMSYDSNLPAWVRGEGPEADVIISTRARLARSLASIPFPSRASGEDLIMVVQRVRNASVGLIGRFPKLKAVSIDSLSDEERSFLLDSHIASVEQINGGKGRIVLLEPSATLSIMVNEEDHLRLQVIMSGLAPEEAWEMVDWADDVLASKLDYGYSDRYGYLTASVTNVGTGLRVSAMMHLAGLAYKKKLGAQLRAAFDLGVSIRGVFGESSRSVGDLFQVSNEITLGLSEREIVERVRAVAQYLLEEERDARRELLNEKRTILIENTKRSLEVLQSVRSISAEQAIKMMSPVRLAAELGLVENYSRCLLNEVLIGLRVGTGDDEGVNTERAELIRNKLAGLDIVSR